MITYVNTVLVGKGTPKVVTSSANFAAGKYVIAQVGEDVKDANGVVEYLDASNIGNATRIKVGLITNKTVKDQNGNSHPVIKWSNEIKAGDIKSFNVAEYTADTAEKVEIQFSGIEAATLNKLAEGNKRVLIRITYKDLPTRYRKWTDTYEYLTKVNDTAATIAAGVAAVINKEWKRSRVEATIVGGTKVVLTALPYEDDNAVDTINEMATVRFSVNAYYTDPEADDGFSAKNKYSINGLSISKTPGKVYQASAKLVRDREAQAMGYQGILNRGDGTWPVIKPEMQTKLDGLYNAVTLEFENMYRAADDIFRKTKQTLEIYDEFTPSNDDEGAQTWKQSDIVSALSNFVNGTVPAPTTGEG